uniref:hypothetical protein n=2 Tax=Roseivirga sp. TaxID=1964215 RepID=UPI004047B471
MKRIPAILLLVCLGIYQFGYYAADFSVGLQIERKWSDKIFSEEGEYENSFVMNIPIDIPYMPNDQDFKVVNSSFEKDGQFFRVLEQRYQDGNLQLVVVADTYKSNLEVLIKDWIDANAADIEGNLMSKSPLKVLTNQYTPTSEFKLLLSSMMECENSFGDIALAIYASRLQDTPAQPPEA